MTPRLYRNISGVLLVLWGLLNSVGGLLSTSDTGSVIIPFLFAVVGICIAIAGVSMLVARKWALSLAAVALISLSLTALYSGVVLRGWSELNLVHHLTRFLVSGVVFGIGIQGRDGNPDKKSKSDQANAA